jgi:hypothetical protein
MLRLRTIHTKAVNHTALTKKNQAFWLIYPCRCLCLGFLQITRNTRLRLMILQCLHSRFTDAPTFIRPPHSS